MGKLLENAVIPFCLCLGLPFRLGPDYIHTLFASRNHLHWVLIVEIPQSESLAIIHSRLAYVDEQSRARMRAELARLSDKAPGEFFVSDTGQVSYCLSVRAANGINTGKFADLFLPISPFGCSLKKPAFTAEEVVPLPILQAGG